MAPRATLLRSVAKHAKRFLMTTTPLRIGAPPSASAVRTGPPPLVHALAIVTFVAALPLLFLGAEVTTKGVGMVDQVPVRSPWYFLTEFMTQNNLGWLIEHGHRQVGWIVGLCTIFLTLAACTLDSRRPVKVLSVVTLL